MTIEKATFGAGCFWGVEAAFAAIPGVTATAVGYEGGSLDRPTYKDVCTDQTGHAEVVELDFDPAQVSFEQLLDAFFALHDPTTLNRQGPDWGAQYRSAIFFHSPEQEAQALAKIEQLTAEGMKVRVVSMPSWELFERQPREYREQVLPPSVRKRIAVETGSAIGWQRYVGLDGAVIARSQFGASAPLKDLLKQFGFTTENVLNTAKALLGGKSV